MQYGTMQIARVTSLRNAAGLYGNETDIRLLAHPQMIDFYQITSEFITIKPFNRHIKQAAAHRKHTYVCYS